MQYQYQLAKDNCIFVKKVSHFEVHSMDSVGFSSNLFVKQVQLKRYWQMDRSFSS